MRVFPRLGQSRKSSLGLALWFLAVLALWAQGYFSAIDRWTLDALQSKVRALSTIDLHVQHDPVIVGMDEAFLGSVETPIALSHFWLADALVAVSRAKPSVIGIDFVFPEKRYDALLLKDHPEVDFHRQLLRGLARAAQSTPLVAVKVWDADHARFRSTHIDFESVLLRLRPNAQVFASAMLCTDSDGTVRRIPQPSCQPDGSSSGLAHEMASAMGKAPFSSGFINYRVGKNFDYVPLMDVIEAAKRDDTAWLSAKFEGRPVLFGSVLQDIDSHYAAHPLAQWLGASRQVPGVLIHGQILRNLLTGTAIQPMPAWLTAVLIGLSVLMWQVRSIGLGFGLVFGLLAAGTALQGWLMMQSLWLPLSGFWVMLITVWLGRITVDNLHNLAEKRRLTKLFGGFVSPSVLTQILEGELDGSGQGSTMEVAVLFSDIRNFTSFSESQPPEQVVSLLNSYFGRMTRIVHECGGTVDKFIGDGLMAFFGAPNTLKAPCSAAVQCAIRMQGELIDFNRERQQAGLSTVAIGIGLHVGPAVIGHVGSPERYEYTAIGDTVNATARLEGLCKGLQAGIVCSEELMMRLHSEEGLSTDERVNAQVQWIDFGPQALKGRADMVVFGVKVNQ